MNAHVATAPVERVARTAVSTLPYPVGAVAPIRRATEARPNDPCSCGCGRKAKKCGIAGEGLRTTLDAPGAVAPVAHEATPVRPPEPGQHAEPATEPVAESLAHDAPMEAPAACTPLAAEGTGCAAWMRLTGLYPWKPVALSARRAGLDRLVRYTRQWMLRRKARGAFRTLPNPDQLRQETADAAWPASELTGAVTATALDTYDAEPSEGGLDNAAREAALLAKLVQERAHAEPSYELAAELEMSEAKLNQGCREATGLSAREWWDAVRAPEAVKAIRAEIEAALDHAELDRTAQIRRRGIQVMDLHRALRQHRRALGSAANDRAWQLGFKSAARLNLALWRATGQTIQQLEMSILREIFQTWSFDHQTCRLCAKIEPRSTAAVPCDEPSVPGLTQPFPVDWNPGIRIA